MFIVVLYFFSSYSGKPTAAEPDVHHIDFRVGKIVSAKKHPDADTLFVEESKFFSFFFSFVCLLFRNPCERLKRKWQISESKTVLFEKQQLQKTLWVTVIIFLLKIILIIWNNILNFNIDKKFEFVLICTNWIFFTITDNYFFYMVVCRSTTLSVNKLECPKI